MNFSYDFSGRTALVTGGVSGIGAAVSAAFLKAGARVIACGLTEAELAAARTDAALAGADVRALDVTDNAAVVALVGSLPALDFVVNCAGVIRRDAEHDPAVFDQVLDVNVSGGMRVSTAARPLLARSGGAIVFIGSVMSFFGGPPSAGLLGLQGRGAQPDHVAGERLCRRRHPGQRGRARLGDHPAVARRPRRPGA